jgi:RNA methyltransferase, TrmH family
MEYTTSVSRADLESVHGMRAALAAFRARTDDVVHVAYTEAARYALAGVLSEAARRRIAYAERSDEDLARIAGVTHHEGVCIALRPQPSPGPAELEALLDEEVFLAVLLDGVTNPHNVGAIVRSMAHFGASALIVGEGNGPALSPAAVRVAEGGAEHVVVFRAPLDRAIERLRARDVTVVVADQAGPPRDRRWPRRVAIVLGSERSGVSPELRALADATVSIPGTGAVESLNVSVAAAVLLAWASAP